MVGTSILGSWNGHWKDRSTRISSTARPTDLCANFTCCCGFSGHGVQPSSPPWWSHGGCEKTNIATENSPFIEDLNSLKKNIVYYIILNYSVLTQLYSYIILYWYTINIWANDVASKSSSPWALCIQLPQQRCGSSMAELHACRGARSWINFLRVPNLILKHLETSWNILKLKDHPAPYLIRNPFLGMGFGWQVGWLWHSFE